MATHKNSIVFGEFVDCSKYLADTGITFRMAPSQLPRDWIPSCVMGGGPRATLLYRNLEGKGFEWRVVAVSMLARASASRKWLRQRPSMWGSL
jgi:hypothetical protein